MNIFGWGRVENHGNFVTQWANKIYNKLPEIPVSFKDLISNAFNVGRDFAWKNKECVAGGAAAITVALLLINRCRNRAQLPKAILNSSLDCAIIEIKTPKVPPIPSRASITFCIDKSSSMAEPSQLDPSKPNNTRLMDVKEALH